MDNLVTALAESLVGRHTALERQARWLSKGHFIEVTGSPGIVPWMNGNLRVAATELLCLWGFFFV